MKVVLTTSAEEDLLNGFHFYERRQQHLGDYFLDSLFAVRVGVLDSRQNPTRILAELSGRL